jgi:trigger factor
LIDNKAEIFARPLPAANQEPHNFDINEPKEYKFEFEIGTRPAFSIPVVEKKQTVPYYKVIVSHEMLQDEIEKLQYKAGDIQEVEEITSENNVLGVTFEEAQADGTVVEGGIKKDNSFLLKYFTPAGQSALFGKKKEDAVVLVLQDAFDAKLLPAIMNELGLNANTASDKEKHFKITITKLELIDPAPLTKETFEKIYPGRNIETETEFKDVLTQEIQRYWDGQAQIRLHNELFEILVHETPIQMPVDFLKRWMSVGGEKYVAPEEVEKNYGSFDHQMRWQLISEQLVKQFSLEVEEEELEMGARQQIMSYFSSYGQMPSFDDDWMEPLVKKQLADQKFREELYNKIMTDKLFYALEQELKLEEKNVQLEEFVKLPSAHHHHH